MLLALAVGALIVVAWPVPERPVVTGATVTQPPVGSAPPATTLPPTPTTEPDPGEVKVLVTPTGVVVPVIAESSDGYIVTSPCGNPARVAWGRPIFEADVVLDPGHGGEVETGAVAGSGLTEKELNLDVAKRTARELERRGISVVLTRTADYRMPLVTRAAVANRLSAGAIVSIHHNAPNANPSSIPGTEVFFQTGSDESRRLAGIVYEEVFDALSAYDLNWTTATDAGALTVENRDGDDAYGMIRRPRVPAVLAEIGYLSNPEEAELFATDDYRRVASRALADAIERWLTTDDAGSGYVDDPRVFTPSGSTGGTDGCIDPDLG